MVDGPARIDIGSPLPSEPNSCIARKPPPGYAYVVREPRDKVT